MSRFVIAVLTLLTLLGVLGAACGRVPNGANNGSSSAVVENAREDQPTRMPDYDIVTLLPPDAIPAIYDPTFLSPAEAAQSYAPDELVLGVEINGDARAYSLPFLSGHEIVNDTVGGRPIAVTW